MEPVELFNDQELLFCAHCGKNLFEDPAMSIVVFVENRETGNFTDVYTCCKGECDHALKATRVGKSHSDGWKDITDFMNPLTFMKNWMAVTNNLNEGVKFSEQAIKRYKDILIATAPYVMRQPTKSEKEDFEWELQMPF